MFCYASHSQDGAQKIEHIVLTVDYNLFLTIRVLDPLKWFHFFTNATTLNKFHREKRCFVDDFNNGKNEY